MFRLMCGHRRRDKIKNEAIRAKVVVAPIENKMRKDSLSWFSHAERRPSDAPLRRCEQGLDTLVKRGRGGPRRIWKKTIRKDMEHPELTEVLTKDRPQWHKQLHKQLHIANPI